MTDREAIRMALEALINGKQVRSGEGGTKYQPELEDAAIEALEAALAQPEQEELIQFKDNKWSYVRKPWVGLTVNEARDFFESKLTRSELITEISEFLEEKNGG